MSTRLELRDNLREEIKIDDKERIWSDAILNRNLETSKRQVQQDGNHDWFFNDAENTETTVAGTREYSLPSDFVRVERRTVLYNGNLMLKTTLNAIKRTFSDFTQQGTPNYYYVRGTIMGLHLIPNEAKTLNYLYRKKLPDYTADSDDSGMPSEFDEAMIQYAAYLTWNDVQGRQDKAVEAIQNYKQALEGLKQQYILMRAEDIFTYNMERTTLSHKGRLPYDYLILSP